MGMSMTAYAEAICDGDSPGCKVSVDLDCFELAEGEEAWQCDFELPANWTGDKDECFCGPCSEAQGELDAIT